MQMLGKVFQRFVQKSPVSVMVGGILERVLNPGRLDELFDCVAERQYTRELLFSTVFDLLSQVVCGVRPSLHAAYQASVAEISVSLTSVYNKLNGVEPETAAALVHYSAHEVTPLITEIGGTGASVVPGYRTKILDGNCLAATEHRLKELRQTAAGALPGKALVVLDPALRRAVTVVPCEDGYTQERALVHQVLPQVAAGEVWIADRNFCPRPFLFGLVERGAAFIIRQHQGLPWEPVGPERPVGRVESGRVYEHPIGIPAEDGRVLRLRRVRLELDHPTQDGDTELCLLTNLPPEVANAQRIATAYRKRWTIEQAFQDLATFLRSAINTLGYPRAALFGFCVAVVAYNVLAVVKAALSRVHGVDKIDHEVSGYYLADEIAGTYRGMLIAIPPEAWHLFSLLTIAQLAALLLQLARHVNLAAFRKHPRGPKKPAPRRRPDKRHPHVSTARLVAQRRGLLLSP
jgi:IS4 transposase